MQEGSRHYRWNSFLNKKLKKKMGSPKSSDPCGRSSKKSKKHCTAATRHLVWEWCKSEKDGHSRWEGYKFEKSDAPKVWEGCAGTIANCPVIEVKRRSVFGNFHLAEKTEGWHGRSESKIEVKRKVKKWNLHTSQANRPAAFLGGCNVYLYIRVWI